MKAFRIAVGCGVLVAGLFMASGCHRDRGHDVHYRESGHGHSRSEHHRHYDRKVKHGPKNVEHKSTYKSERTEESEWQDDPVGDEMIQD